MTQPLLWLSVSDRFCIHDAVLGDRGVLFRIPQFPVKALCLGLCLEHNLAHAEIRKILFGKCHELAAVSCPSIFRCHPKLTDIAVGFGKERAGKLKGAE